MENKQLYTALSEARKKFPKIVKDSQGQRSKYAKLPDILDVVVPVLKEFGLYLEQPTIFQDGVILLNTKIIHIETGQLTQSFFPLTIDTESNHASKDQKEGGTQTYHKRYQLLNLLGICGEDDDQDGDVPARKTYSTPAPSQKISQTTIEASTKDYISDKQLYMLRMRLKENPEEEAKLLDKYKIDDLSKLSWKYMNEVVAALKPKE